MIGDERLSRIKTVTNDSRLIIITRPEITSGSRNVNEISVVLDKTWNFDSAEYFVNFYTDDETNGMIRRLVFSGSTGSCVIPYYITEKEGFFHFGIFAKADDDIIKTSEVAAYEVRKGINTHAEGNEHETFKELRKLFIDLINANCRAPVLDYSMRFEDIDMSYTNFMSQVNSTLGNLNEFTEALYSVVKEYINPDLERISDSSMAYIFYFAELENYLRENADINLDSVMNDIQSYSDFKHQILQLINDYVDEDFDSSSDIIMYAPTLESYLQTSSTAMERCGKIRTAINNLCAQEDE